MERGEQDGDEQKTMETKTKDEDKQIWLSFGYKYFQRKSQIQTKKKSSQCMKQALLDQKMTARVS